MALVKVKPTSPGRRSLVKVVNRDLHKGPPHASLVERQSRRAGRNNFGHITMRHQGGGHKQHYRLIDFRRNKDTIPARVERIEYDPNRSANIALLCYADGERRYIIAPKGLVVGSQLVPGSEQCVAASRALMERGFWVAAIRSPTVPVGTERLRITLTAAHTDDEIDSLVEALAEVLKR